MKINEIWKSKKIYGPIVRVKIVGLKDERIKYDMILSEEPSVSGECFRWQFLSLYEKDYNESR